MLLNVRSHLSSSSILTLGLSVLVGCAAPGASTLELSGEDREALASYGVLDVALGESDALLYDGAGELVGRIALGDDVTLATFHDAVITRTDDEGLAVVCETGDIESGGDDCHAALAISAIVLAYDRGETATLGVSVEALAGGCSNAQIRAAQADCRAQYGSASHGIHYCVTAGIVDGEGGVWYSCAH